MKKILKLIILFLIMTPCTTYASLELEKQMVSMISAIDNYEKKAFLNNHSIGSIYITTNTDESTVAKMASKYGGTWEVYGAGKMLVGVNTSDSNFSTVNKTGGSKTNTLTSSNIPSHSHTIGHTHTTSSTSIASSGAHTHTIAQKSITVSNVSSTTNGSHTHSFNTGGSVLIVKGASTATITSGLKNIDNGGWWNGHNKNYYTALAWNSGHTHTISGSITSPAIKITASSGSHAHDISAKTTGAASTSNSGSTGSGTSFSNLDPYITVYMYKRTA